MADRTRLQIRTNLDPEVWSDVGSGAAGVPIPVDIETSVLPTGASTSSNQTNGTQKTQIVEKEPTDTTHLNPSLTITESVLGTVTTTTIQQTIGADVYQQTIEEDSSDNSVNVSIWSEL